MNKQCNSQSTETPVVQPSLSPEEFHDWLTDLAKRWLSVGEKDLELRHETGVLLNEAFGSSTVRQAYGKGVLKEASGLLEISVSDISRMRRFARRFKTIEDLKRQHPEVGNWTAVKQLLARLSEEDKKAKAAANGTQASKPKKSKPKASPAKGLGKSIETLSTKLRGATSLSEREKKDLLDKVRVLVQSVSDCLGVEVSLNLDNVVETPPLEPPPAEAGPPAEADGGDVEVPAGTSKPVDGQGHSLAVQEES
jgi:hypothetical protein